MPNERQAVSKVTQAGILVEFMHAEPGTASRQYLGMFKTDTPVVVQALVIASQGYGSVEEVYEALAPSQGLPAILPDSEREVIRMLEIGVPMEGVIAALMEPA